MKLSKLNTQAWVSKDGEIAQISKSYHIPHHLAFTLTLHPSNTWPCFTLLCTEDHIKKNKRTLTNNHAM